MPIDEILVTALPGDRRAAALENGELVKLAYSGGEEELRRGDVLVGRVAKRAPSLGGAFVDLGRGRPPGLLMLADGPADRTLSEGDPVAVEVLRQAEAGKGPKLSARLGPVARAAVEAAGNVRPPALLARGPDPVTALISEAAKAGVPRVVTDDPQVLQELRAAFSKIAEIFQLWLNPQSLFAARGVDTAIEDALLPVVGLSCGGRLIIEETAALTSIDVDTGGAIESSARSGALAVNLEAAAAIGREVRLRDLAGIIVIDFVPLRRPVERDRVLATLRLSLADDGRPSRIGGWTRLGLVEIIRERRGPSLGRRVSIPCLACSGTGRAESPRWAAGDALRRVLSEAWDCPRGSAHIAVSPAVAAVLRGPLADARAEVERRLGRTLVIVEDADLVADGYSVCWQSSRHDFGTSG